MARNVDLKDIIYLFVNTVDHNTITSGISLRAFINALPNPPANLLLLKYQFEEAEVHLATQLSYVSLEQLNKLISSERHSHSEYCWIDFEDLFNLDTIEGQELAELLYLGHLKKHLKLPFYQTLNNRFVYLTDNDSWMNKVFYRNWQDFYIILSSVLSNKLSEMKLDKSIVGFWKKKNYPPIDTALLRQLNPLLTEGIVISYANINQTRGQIEIPIWIVGDFFNMDEMADVYEERSKNKPDGLLIFDKKLKSWSIKISNTQ